MSHPSHGYGEPKCASGVGFGHMHPGRTLVGAKKERSLRGLVGCSQLNWSTATHRIREVQQMFFLSHDSVHLTVAKVHHE